MSNKKIIIGLCLCVATSVICMEAMYKTIEDQKKGMILINQFYLDAKLPSEAAAINILKLKDNTGDLQKNIKILKEQVHYTFNSDFTIESIDYSDINLNCEDYERLVINVIPKDSPNIKLINSNCNKL